MSGALAANNGAAAIEQALIGNLAGLTEEQRLSYYDQTCKSLGLNPLTKPFAFITLNGKLTMYALKDCTEQLRKIHNVSLAIVAREHLGDVYVVTARATLPNGRCDESIGAVTIGAIKGDALANALMKAETKAKRRVTLSICGLGILDEAELETIPEARGAKHAAAMSRPEAAVATSPSKTSDPVAVYDAEKRDLVAPDRVPGEDDCSDEEIVSTWLDMIKECTGAEDMSKVVAQIAAANLSAAIKDRIRDAYAARRKELGLGKASAK